MNLPPSTYLRVAHTDLQAFIAQMGQTVGLPTEKAELLAEMLTANDLRGVFSHLWEASWTPRPRGTDGAAHAAGSAADLARLIDTVGQRERARTNPVAPALVVPDHLRPGIADLVRRQRLPTPVLSQSEIDEAVDLIIVERL